MLSIIYTITNFSPLDKAWLLVLYYIPFSSKVSVTGGKINHVEI